MAATASLAADGPRDFSLVLSRPFGFVIEALGKPGTIVPFTIYQMYGDTRILERSIESMIRWVDWCKANSTNLIRDKARGNDYGDAAWRRAHFAGVPAPVFRLVLDGARAEVAA
jgi:hypothetical protein